VSVIETWNSLPHDAINAQTLRSLKINLIRTAWADHELLYDYPATTNTGNWKLIICISVYV